MEQKLKEQLISAEEIKPFHFTLLVVKQ